MLQRSHILIRGVEVTSAELCSSYHAERSLTSSGLDLQFLFIKNRGLLLQGQIFFYSHSQSNRSMESAFWSCTEYCYSPYTTENPFRACASQLSLFGSSYRELKDSSFTPQGRLLLASSTRSGTQSFHCIYILTGLPLANNDCTVHMSNCKYNLYHTCCYVVFIIFVYCFLFSNLLYRHTTINPDFDSDLSQKLRHWDFIRPSWRPGGMNTLVRSKQRTLQTGANKCKSESWVCDGRATTQTTSQITGSDCHLKWNLHLSTHFPNLSAGLNVSEDIERGPTDEHKIDRLKTLEWRGGGGGRFTVTGMTCDKGPRADGNPYWVKKCLGTDRGTKQVALSNNLSAHFVLMKPQVLKKGYRRDLLLSVNILDQDITLVRVGCRLIIVKTCCCMTECVKSVCDHNDNQGFV